MDAEQATPVRGRPIDSRTIACDKTALALIAQGMVARKALVETMGEYQARTALKRLLDAGRVAKRPNGGTMDYVLLDTEPQP